MLSKYNRQVLSSIEIVLRNHLAQSSRGSAIDENGGISPVIPTTKLRLGNVVCRTYHHAITP
jgi:hypothetical protein